MAKDWKDRLGIVYSTNENFEYDTDKEVEKQTLKPEDQNLKVQIDKKNRKGKTVTLITGFIGTSDDLKDLEKSLKNKCGVGGSSKNGEIIIQGNLKDKVAQILKKLGYKVKIIG